MRMEAGSVLSLRFALDSNQPSHGSFFLSFALRDTLVYTPYRCRPSEILGDRATKKKLSPWPLAGCLPACRTTVMLPR
jgi:hypothetical protein